MPERSSSIENEKMTDDERKQTVFRNLPIIMNKAKEYGNNRVVCAATKKVSADVINYAASQGLETIGENRVQELLEKYPLLDKSLDIYFIGKLQTNKVKYIVDKVSMIQSVDSAALAYEINKQCAKIGKIMDVLIEVNIANEETKSGVSRDKAGELADYVLTMPYLRLRGIMVIPPACNSKDESIGYFSESYKIFIDICKNKLHNIKRDGEEFIFSAGMSGDYEQALMCGSTMIRPGRALFGERYYT